MKPNERITLAFLVVVVLVAGGLLLLPSIQQGTSSVGISGALGLPMWALVGILGALAVLSILLVLVNIRRRKNGRPPL